MRKTLLACSAFALMAFGGAAVADQPGPDWISKEKLTAQMQKAGYSAIVVSADDDHWEGEAVKNGRIVEFHADARTGRITKSEPKTE